MTKRSGCLGIMAWSLFAAGSGCSAPSQGERCNPMLFNVSDQCATGLSCGVPANCGVVECVNQGGSIAQCQAQCATPGSCGVAYCCPAQVTVNPDGGTCNPCQLPDGATRG
jgi:hypothetical protein